MSIEAIVFDFGGVLLRWDASNILRPFFASDDAGLHNFLREIEFANWNAEQDRGRSFADGIAQLTTRFPKYATMIHALHERWEDSLVDQIDGSVQILLELKRAAYPLFGLSNWSAETFPIARQRYNFFDVFDGIIISGAVGMIKPDPAIFARCLQMIGRAAENCLFIDDSSINVLAAQALGFETILFETPEQLRSELNARKILKAQAERQ